MPRARCERVFKRERCSAVSPQRGSGFLPMALAATVADHAMATSEGEKSEKRIFLFGRMITIPNFASFDQGSAHDIRARQAVPLALSVSDRRDRIGLFGRSGFAAHLGERGWMVLCSLAVVFSALNGGFGPAILAATMGLILATFVIFEPRGLLALAETANLLPLGLIALVSLSIGVWFYDRVVAGSRPRGTPGRDDYDRSISPTTRPI